MIIKPILILVAIFTYKCNRVLCQVFNNVHLQATRKKGRFAFCIFIPYKFVRQFSGLSYIGDVAQFPIKNIQVFYSVIGLPTPLNPRSIFV